METIDGKTQKSSQSKSLIVLPCFNAGGKIARALKSATTINLDYELVIVDDCSTDNTIEASMVLSVEQSSTMTNS